MYAVNPGLPVYTIGSPMFGQAKIKVSGNKMFVIKALNNSKENKYIQSATLNGQPFNRTWIGHNEIIAGGELEFKMGAEPNKKWGVGKDALPSSMTGSK